MLPNHRPKSRLNSASLRKSFANGRSLARSFPSVGLGRACRARFGPTVFAPGLNLAASALFDRGSSRTQ